MSETLDPMATDVDQHELAQQLVAHAKVQGIELVGPDGLLNRLTKNVLETALEAEIDDHLGYEKHDVAGRGSGNSRIGTRTKTVLTDGCVGWPSGSWSTTPRLRFSGDNGWRPSP